MANKKGSKKKKTENKASNKLMISIALIVILLFIIIFLIVNSSNKITCTKKTDGDKISMSSNINFNFKKKKLNIIKVKKIITVDSSNVDYLSAIKKALEETYKDLKVTYDLKIEDDKLTINITYDKEKEYILDNLYLDIEGEGISINVVSEDSENNFATIDMSKKYTKDEVKSILSKAKYECK